MDVMDQAAWSTLPSIVLENILSLLPPKDRHAMSLVCRAWSLALLSARAWHHLQIHGRSFTIKDYSVLLGYHRRLDCERLRGCLELVGHHIRKLTIKPMDNYIHLQQLLKALYRYRELLTSLKEFHFAYSCETRNRSGSFLHGVGSPVLNLILNVLVSYGGAVSYVTLNNLMLSRENIGDFQNKMVEIIPDVSKLELRNSTAEGIALRDIGRLRSLETFITSPQQVDDVLLISLAENGLKVLHLVQDNFTGYAAPMGRPTWQKIRQINPTLRVKLVCCGQYKHDVLVQQGAPVSHVVYDTPHSVISPVTISGISDYAETLVVYGHKSLPKIHGRMNTHDRADSLLLLLIENCPKLETLIVRDRISSASVLLIAKKCEYLKFLYVRRNSILTRLDWSQDQNWSDEFYLWLKRNCKSMEKMEAEVGKILGYGWRTLTDGEYGQLSDVDI